jgi:uncharacterized protein
MPRVIPPVPDADDEPFWAGVAEGRLRLQRCADCRTVQHPPSPMCPICQSVRREWFDVSGRGSVYSWIQSHHPTAADESPRIVALIDLDEGARIVSNLRDVELSTIESGLSVEVFFDEIDGTKLPQFRPVEPVKEG